MQQAWQLILLLLLQGYQHCITILDMRLIHILEILMGITTKVKINIMPTSNQQLILLIIKWELVKIQTTAGYQSTTAGYQSGGYASQTSVWNGGNNGSYPPYDYSNYTAPDPNANHNASSVSGAPLQYQQQYNQWPTHYSQASSNVLCAPGTEKRVVSNSSNDSPVPGSSGGCSYGNNQPPPPGTTSWRQDFASTGLPSSQGMNDAMRYNQNGSYNAVATGDQNHQINQMPSYFQTSSNLLHHSDVLHSENQQKTVFSQGPNFQFPVTNQLSQNFQSPSQTAYTPDAHQGTKIQIPTNPRIALNLAVNASKTDKESTTVDSTLKPVYISVSAPNKKEYSQDSAENISKGAIPASLRRYVDRTFARCKDDAQRASNQIIMKEMITKSSADGTLLTRNWDMEPLFPLANNSADTADKKSPVRRTKSRWEPLPEEKFVEKLHSANHVSIKSVWNRPKDNTKVTALLMCNGINFGNKENSWSSLKFVPSQQQPSTPNTQRPLKKQRYSDTDTVDGGDISSESDKEQNLTKYYSSAIALADTPEERKRREHRSKRFEEGQEHQSEFNYSRQKGVGVRRLYTQRTKALLLAKNCQDVSNNVVEDISWDSFTVKGTCHEIEKRYLRLTSSPDPASVRPEEVLEKALVMVQSSQKNYLYKCDQLKSIRQDLTVQRIRNQLTAKVYETHARFALEAGDLAEFNQCQSQLKSLYAEGIKGCHLEFSAYSLLSLTLHSNNKRELLSSMARLPAEAKKDEAVGHAFAVCTAVMTGNYIMFFRLYKKAPNLSICFMDLYVERMRFEAVSCMCKSYRPAVPVAYVARVLGFSKVSLEDNEGDSDGVEECEEWLRAHGASLIADNGDMQLDTKASSSNLFMPEPDDAVVHGDANLAVDDFLTRAT